MEKDDERQQDPSPPSEQTLSKRMKLESNKDVQFGYQGTLYNPQSPALIITSDGLGAEGADMYDFFSCEAYGARPLKGRAEFEVKITKTCRTITQFDVGVVFVSKYRENGLRRYIGEVSFSVRPTVPGKQLYTAFNSLDNGERSLHGQIDLRDLREGDRVGLHLSEDGVLEFTVNGENQGIAAKNIYTRNRYRDIYAYVRHWNAVATEITKAGKMTILNTIQTVHSMTITHAYQEIGDHHTLSHLD